MTHDFPEILAALDEYALIKTERSYLLFHVTTQSYVVIEENSRVLYEMMLERHVKVVDSVGELRDPNFVHYAMVNDRINGGLRNVRVDQIAHLVYSKADLVEQGDRAVDLLRSWPRGISTAQRVLSIVHNLIVDSNKDFRIDLRLTDRDVYIKPRGFNTLPLAKVAELFASYSTDQLNELRKKYMSTEEVQHLPATEIARTLKSDDFVVVVIKDTIQFTLRP